MTVSWPEWPSVVVTRGVVAGQSPRAAGVRAKVTFCDASVRRRQRSQSTPGAGNRMTGGD